MTMIRIASAVPTHVWVWDAVSRQWRFVRVT